MKKIITLIMAFLVCAAMAVPAFASTADTTITGFSVNVYSYHRLTPRTKDDSSAVYFYYRDGSAITSEQEPLVDPHKTDR